MRILRFMKSKFRLKNGENLRISLLKEKVSDLFAVYPADCTIISVLLFSRRTPPQAHRVPIPSRLRILYNISIIVIIYDNNILQPYFENILNIFLITSALNTKWTVSLAGRKEQIRRFLLGEIIFAPHPHTYTVVAHLYKPR